MGRLHADEHDIGFRERLGVVGMHVDAELGGEGFAFVLAADGHPGTRFVDDAFIEQRARQGLAHDAAADDPELPVGLWLGLARPLLFWPRDFGYRPAPAAAAGASLSAG